MKKTLVRIATAASLVAFVAGPAAANSKSYCDSKARQAANTQALGKTVIGAGVGCLLGVAIFHKCGGGAAVGGVSGFAIGSVQWKKVYNSVYSQCRKN